MKSNKLSAGLVMVAALAWSNLSHAAEKVRTVEIKVTENGFEPARVKVVKGDPLKLIVTRTTNNICATEIEIHDANIRADLPLNKPVTLTLTPQVDGNLKYTCNMNVYE
jgi:plastocyanin domain-containing protein